VAKWNILVYFHTVLTNLKIPPQEIFFFHLRKYLWKSHKM